jgi:hypothetical protein
VAVVAPIRCRNGHPLGPNQVLLGTTVCEQGGVNRHHISWICRTCDDVIVANGHPEACEQPG